MIHFILHIHISVGYSSVCNYRIVLILSITCMIFPFSSNEGVEGVRISMVHFCQGMMF